VIVISKPGEKTTISFAVEIGYYSMKKMKRKQVRPRNLVWSLLLSYWVVLLFIFDHHFMQHFFVLYSPCFDIKDNSSLAWSMKMIYLHIINVGWEVLISHHY